MSEQPDSMAYHQIRDDLERELFEVLEKYCGDRVNGQLSINADKAVVGLIVVLSQLMCHFEDKYRNDLFRAMRDRMNKLAREKRAEAYQAGNA